MNSRPLWTELIEIKQQMEELEDELRTLRTDLFEMKQQMEELKDEL